MRSISKLSLVFLLAYSNGLVIDVEQTDELIGVAVLYRHGDRSPLVESLPNDPHHDLKYWPNGYGQLLDAGKLRQFNLGKWLRTRYNGFLPEVYNSSDILVRSSNVDRTLMSAASNLAGLYYPTDESTLWQKDLPWNPVPIHTIQAQDDNVIALRAPCKHYQKLYNSTLNSPYIRDVLKQHEALKVSVEEKTGLEIKDISSFQMLNSLFYVYRMHNPSYLPEWIKQIDMNELTYLAGLYYELETNTTELQRLRLGPFFNYLHNHFNGIINGSSPKFLMLSAHDGNVASILNTYGAYTYQEPEFAETIIWELHKSAKGVYVKIFNGNTGGLKQLNLKQCQNQCSYDNYLKLMKPISVDSAQWKKECDKAF